MNRYAVESIESLKLGRLIIGTRATIAMRSGELIVGVVRRREGAELIVDGGRRVVDEDPPPKETKDEAAEREALERLPDGHLVNLADVQSLHCSPAPKPQGEEIWHRT